MEKARFEIQNYERNGDVFEYKDNLKYFAEIPLTS